MIKRWHTRPRNRGKHLRRLLSVERLEIRSLLSADTSAVGSIADPAPQQQTEVAQVSETPGQQSIDIDRIQQMKPQDFGLLSAEEIVFLTTEQIASIAYDDWFAAIPAPVRAVLTTEQVQALDVHRLGLQRLTSDQISKLTVPQIQSLRYHHFPELNAGNIQYLTGEQLRSIPNDGRFRDIPADVRAGLTDEQISQLDVTKIWIGSLMESQREKLVPEQIQQLSWPSFSFLTGEQVPFLEPDQIEEIPDADAFLALSRSVRAEFSPTQIASLRDSIRTALPARAFDNLSWAGVDENGISTDARTMMEWANIRALLPEPTAAYEVFRTVRSGSWSDPDIWERGAIPTDSDGQRPELVIIQHGVIYDAAVQVDNPAFDWISIEDGGSLTFDNSDARELYVETMIVSTLGELHIGSAENPISRDHPSRLVFADEPNDDIPVDDHRQLSRGLLSRGKIRVYGDPVTPAVELSRPTVEEQFAQLEFGFLNVDTDQATDWRVGDQVVFPGLDPDTNDDELRTITSVSFAFDRRWIGFDQPVLQDHLPTHPGTTVHVVNVSRSVSFMSENTEELDRRGHIMMVHNRDIVFENAGFYGLGRQDKSALVDEFRFDEQGNPVSGANQRGRYSLHFHRQGVDPDLPNLPDGQAARVSGSALVDSPGWGYVNHKSNVDFVSNVSFDVVGSAFVTEDGDEIGSFRDNISVRTHGSGGAPDADQRTSRHDFGHAGHGFWLQGPLVEVSGNTSYGDQRSGFMFFTRSDRAAVRRDIYNKLRPGSPLDSDREEYEVDTLPLGQVTGNTAIGGRVGFESWFHQVQGFNRTENNGVSVVDDFTSWNIRIGMLMPYTGSLLVDKAVLIGQTLAPSGVAIQTNDDSYDITFRDVTVLGWEVGIQVPDRGRSVIEGGTFAAVRALEIDRALGDSRIIQIDPNGGSMPVFQTLTQQQLAGREQFDIYLNESLQSPKMSIGLFLTEDLILVDGYRVYFAIQSADYIPFTQGSTPFDVPEEFIGLTNRQLWEQFGLATAGQIVPDQLADLPLRLNGFLALEGVS